MHRQLIAICLIVSLMSSSFSRFFVYAGFVLNKKYIATTLCENRDKPWMHCDGNCYFMKKMKQAQDNEKSQEKQAQRNLLQEVCVMTQWTVYFHTDLLQTINTPYKKQASIVTMTSLFRPPRLA